MHERGIVLPLVAVVISAVAALVLVELAVAIPPPVHGRADDTEARLSAMRGTALELYRRDGALPRSLGEIMASDLGPSNLLGGSDPFGPGTDIAWQAAGATTGQLASTGPDARMGTSDDIDVTVDVRAAARARTRTRLRLLREQFLASVYVKTKTATPAQVSALRTAIEEAARLRRQAAGVDGRERRAAAASARREESKAATLLRALGGPPLPDAVEGPGGLLEAMGLPDTLRLDGFGRMLIVTPAGIGSRGADAKEGTDDDL